MEFWLTIIGLLRRRSVLIPVLLVAAMSGALAFTVTPPAFVSRATMVLTLTQFGGSESRNPSMPTDLTNPMLNFNDSLVTTSAILINTMNTKEVAKQLGVQGSTKLVVDDGRSDPDLLGLNGPFLHIRVESTSSEAAARIPAQAQALMREQLHDWQTTLDAPKATFIRLVDVVSPSAPEVDRSRPLKYGLIATALGGAVALGCAYVGHRLLQRRPPRPTAARSAPAAGRRTGPPARPATLRVPPSKRSTSQPRVLVPDVGDPDSDAAPTVKAPVNKNGSKRR